MEYVIVCVCVSICPLITLGKYWLVKSKDGVSFKALVTMRFIFPYHSWKCYNSKKN